MVETDDEALLRAAGEGDRDSFAVLVERHHRSVIQFMHRFLATGDRHTVEDLAQDVFLGAWKAAASFEPRVKVRTWLYGIAVNACLNFKRSLRLRRWFALKDSTADPLVTDELDVEENFGPLTTFVGELPTMQRAALLLRYHSVSTYEEIAHLLGLSVSAVESLLFRARRTLRTRLLDSKSRENPPQVLPELRSESR